LIISDPAANSVHVLDPEGHESFRIVGGEGRRLQTPAGVAVDSEDHIYVGDCERGMVLVYAPDGRFVRYVGDFKGENYFQCPTGIAVDRRTGRLFVLDTPQHYLYVMDLQGNVVRRIGKRRGGTGKGEFTEPTEIAVANDQVAVLDAGSTRIQLFDRDGKYLREFQPTVNRTAEGNKVAGLAADDEGNLYVTSAADSAVHVFSRDGRPMSCFGAEGVRIGEFRYPTGLWVDAGNRIYVADTRNLRVQVFQLTEKR
jgi:DNA-binding beta-propeller fold protein YncE